MKKTILKLSVISGVIAVALIAHPDMPVPFHFFGLDDISTDSTTTYPHSAGSNRTWFVEQTLPVS